MPHQLQLVDRASSRIWERQNSDTDRAYEAFEVYRDLGQQRSLAKVAQKSGKHITLIERWSSRDSWAVRVVAFDRYQSGVINERVLRGTASMRERQVMLAMQMQTQAQQRLLSMSDAELATMRPVDVCAVMRMASEMERQAREVPNTEELPEVQPEFEVRIIRPNGAGMVAVNLDGRYGWIPRDQVDRFRHDHPEAVIIENG